MAAMTARKKALITGGEYGMGRGIGLVLAEEGYDIAFSYYPEVQNDEKAVKTTHELLAKKEQRALALPVTCQSLTARRSFLKRLYESLARWIFL